MSNVIGYLKIGNIKGMATDDKHKDWIELTMVSQSINRNINPTSKPIDALTQSQVQVGAIDIQKKADVSTVELVSATCSGDVFDEVTIDLVKEGKNGREVYYQWVLTNAYISSYMVHSAGAGTIESTENLSLCFEKVKWSYKKSDAKSKQQAPSEAGWDVAKNKQS